MEEVEIALRRIASECDAIEEELAQQPSWSEEMIADSTKDIRKALSVVAAWLGVDIEGDTHG